MKLDKFLCDYCKKEFTASQFNFNVYNVHLLGYETTDNNSGPNKNVIHRICPVACCNNFGTEFDICPECVMEGLRSGQLHVTPMLVERKNNG